MFLGFLEKPQKSRFYTPSHSRKLSHFSLISCVYSLHMAINDVAGEWMYHVWDIIREFPGHNFVSGHRTLKPKKTLKNLKT